MSLYILQCQRVIPLQQHCNVVVEIMNRKYGLFSKYLFQREQQHGGYTKLLDNNKKECLPVITQNKKHSLKQVVSMIYCVSLRCISREEKPNRQCLWEENLVFRIQIFSLMCQRATLEQQGSICDFRDFRKLSLKNGVII